MTSVELMLKDGEMVKDIHYFLHWSSRLQVQCTAKWEANWRDVIVMRQVVDAYPVTTFSVLRQLSCKLK